MAIKTSLAIFTNTDIDFLYTIYNSAETAIVNSSSWAISWVLKRFPQDADSSAIITKTTSSGITFTGTYNSAPATNTQRVDVAIADTDTVSVDPGTYFWELKRTDAGSETVLAYGNLALIASAHGN